MSGKESQLNIQICFHAWELALCAASVRQFDDRAQTLLVTGDDIPAGWTWHMHLSVPGGYFNAIPLTEADGALTAVLTRADLAFGDEIYTLQLVGTRGDVTRHTNCVRLHVGASLAGEEVWPEVPDSFTRAQTAAETAAARAEAAAEETVQTAVRYDAAQTLSDAQKEQARLNIEAVSERTYDTLEMDVENVKTAAWAHIRDASSHVSAADRARWDAGGGAVASVNGKTGAVTLTGADVGVTETRSIPGKNRVNPAELEEGVFITASGARSTNGSYAATGYIPVAPGEVIRGCYINTRGDGAQGNLGMRWIAAYDANKAVLKTLGTDTQCSTFTVPEGVSFLRISYYAATYGTTVMIEANPDGWSAYEPYGDKLQTVLAPDVIVPEGRLERGAPAICLPPVLYVAAGRTIELYNDLCCLTAGRYHVRWVCAVGNCLGRKYRVTGTSAAAGNSYALKMQLYDDDAALVAEAGTTVKIVPALTAAKRVIPIGDSLTNWKAWLQETMLLSENRVVWDGTRCSGLSYDSAGGSYAAGTIRHEGRSGWSAASYLADTEYTFDDRYAGAAAVPGTANPFWDGEKFSLAHYLTAQGKSAPDAVLLFLGTNDLNAGASPAETAARLKTMVDTIRGEYPAVQILVANTIYRSRQDGYGSTGTDNYTANAGAWQYDEDRKVFRLMQAVNAALKGLPNVHILPLAVTHDRDYNFGWNEIAVNPRAAQTTRIPVESVHPTAQGYYQMADVIYSFLCGVL